MKPYYAFNKTILIFCYNTPCRYFVFFRTRIFHFSFFAVYSWGTIYIYTLSFGHAYYKLYIIHRYSLGCFKILVSQNIHSSPRHIVFHCCFQIAALFRFNSYNNFYDIFYVVIFAQTFVTFNIIRHSRLRINTILLFIKFLYTR